MGRKFEPQDEAIDQTQVRAIRIVELPKESRENMGGTPQMISSCSEPRIARVVLLRLDTDRSALCEALSALVSPLTRFSKQAEVPTEVF